MDSQLSSSGSSFGNSEGSISTYSDIDAILNENPYDVAAELDWLMADSQSGVGSPPPPPPSLYCSEKLSDLESNASTTSNATHSDSLSVGSGENPADQILLTNTEVQPVYPLAPAIEVTLGLDRLPRWNGRPWPEKQDQCVDLLIFHLHFLQSLWLKFFHTLELLPTDQCWFPQKIPKYSASSKGYWTPSEGLGKFPDSPTANGKTSRQIGMTHVAKLLFTGIHIHQLNPTNGEYQFYPGVPRCALDLSHLCHNNGCLNPNHSLFEPHAINLNRNVCKRPGHFRISRSRNRNIHRCIRDHFLGGNYNIKLPDCLSESAIEVVNYATIIKPRTYGRTKLKSFVTSYYQHIKPPTPHLADPLTPEEERQLAVELKGRKRIQKEMYGKEKGEQ